MKTPVHGGDLYSAAAHYNIALEEWIDLSTGINPISYPCDNIPISAFTQLPYPGPTFTRAIKYYYGDHSYIPFSGSQEIIQKLPSLLAKLPVILPSIGYQEHHKAWQLAGNTITYYNALSSSLASTEISDLLSQNPERHLLLINPNNPSGTKIPKEAILSWSNAMKGCACLIIDEAFIDLQAEDSLLSEPKLANNILVLRSCGKFFGLGGIRAGFLFAHSKTLSSLELPDNPWPLNGIALDILGKALTDSHWQSKARYTIKRNALMMEKFFSSLFQQNDTSLMANQWLFISYIGPTPYLAHLYETFAKSGILLRLIPVNSTQSILRIGLLDQRDESGISRLKSCIEHASRQPKPID